MPWMQQHLLSLLDLLPPVIEPDDEVPKFHPLKLRMALIERQHFVLSMHAWVEDNASWLPHQGLRLKSGRSPPIGVDPTLTFFRSQDEGPAGSEERDPYRENEVGRLIDLLDLRSSPINQSFIEITVQDMNHIRWDPERARELLSFKVADSVPDSFAWLDRHSAHRQAKALARYTSVPPARPPRSRL
jgi:hypothetical protein